MNSVARFNVWVLWTIQTLVSVRQMSEPSTMPFSLEWESRWVQPFVVWWSSPLHGNIRAWFPGIMLHSRVTIWQLFEWKHIKTIPSTRVNIKQVYWHLSIGPMSEHQIEKVFFCYGLAFDVMVVELRLGARRKTHFHCFSTSKWNYRQASYV